MSIRFPLLRTFVTVPGINLIPWIMGLSIAAVASPAMAQDYAVPALPTTGSTTFDLSQANGGVAGASFDGGATLIAGVSGTASINTANAAANTTLINDAIAYASAHGGGNILLPSGVGSATYLSNEILMSNNVNLDVATNTTLQNQTTTSTFITAAPSATGNIEISGGGIINSNATKTSDNKMIELEGLDKVEVTNVTVENAPNEHLVTECDSNVTINNVTINDAKPLANSDGIDFSGTNVLIQGCNIADGDDDIVAKPDTLVVNGKTAHTGNVIVQNCNITAGHGISIGGQTNAGLDGMYVNNITENGTSEIDDGIHLKAGDGSTTTYQNGGLVKNVTFNNINMTNVDDALVIDSFYNNGGSNLPKVDAYPVSPTDSTEPIWENITMENITISSEGSAAEIYGLDSDPANMVGLNFENIDADNAGDNWKMYYASNIFISNVSVRGLEVPNTLGNYKGPGGQTDTSELADTFVTADQASPIYMPALAPEPGSLTLLGAGSLLALRRRSRSKR